MEAEAFILVSAHSAPPRNCRLTDQKQRLIGGPQQGKISPAIVLSQEDRASRSMPIRARSGSLICPR